MLNSKVCPNFDISINNLINTLKSSSAQLTAGELIEGKRTYTLRAEAISYTPQSAKDIVVKSDFSIEGRSTVVKLEDVADINLSYKKPTSFRRINGEDAITFAVLREPNSNVVKTMENLSNENLEIIEIQTGTYFGEDDIIRIKDSYGRADLH